MTSDDASRLTKCGLALQFSRKVRWTEVRWTEVNSTINEVYTVNGTWNERSMSCGMISHERYEWAWSWMTLFGIYAEWEKKGRKWKGDPLIRRSTDLLTTSRTTYGFLLTGPLPVVVTWSSSVNIRNYISYQPFWRGNNHWYKASLVRK